MRRNLSTRIAPFGLWRARLSVNAFTWLRFRARGVTQDPRSHHAFELGNLPRLHMGDQRVRESGERPSDVRSQSPLFFG